MTMEVIMKFNPVRLCTSLVIGCLIGLIHEFIMHNNIESIIIGVLVALLINAWMLSRKLKGFASQDQLTELPNLQVD
jgi:uncharacterized membrane protein